MMETRPPISKAKMMSITKSALKAIKFYKHIVMNVEKFISKVKNKRQMLRFLIKRILFSVNRNIKFLDYMLLIQLYDNLGINMELKKMFMVRDLQKIFFRHYSMLIDVQKKIK